MTTKVTGAVIADDSFAGNGTWNKPSKGSVAFVRAWGGGGGGGSGASGRVEVYVF